MVGLARWRERPGTRTDIDTRFLETLRLPNLEACRHNMVADVADPLPAKDFDLVHARLVLCHLPEREQVLQRIMAALKPGGWIVIEDADSISDWPDPKLNSDETLLKTNAAMYQILTQRGVDLCFGRKFGGSIARHRIG
jgi:SAM-dependent methyltransferase